MTYLAPLDALRLQRGSEHLHHLGPRAVDGFLRDLAARIGGMPAALALLAEYERRLSPEMLAATGGNRFPPAPMHSVSTEARA
jgi:hypothetical protein